MKTLASTVGARRMVISPLAGLFVLGLLLVWPAQAQLPPATPPQPAASAQRAEEDPLGRQTPYGTVVGFIGAAKDKDYGRAAKYLDTKKQAGAAEELARQLKLVMDRGLKVDIDQISREPEGNVQDESRTTRER